MARVHFNQDIIGELRHRVIDHNKAVGPGGRLTKIEELKDVFKRARRRAKGPGPDGKALAKVDAFLAELAKAGESFDESKVRRDGDGRFAEKPDVAPAKDALARHRSRQATDPEYRALTTDALVDHRAEAIGASLREGIAAAGGVGIALSLLRRGKDGRVGRALRATGEAAGSLGVKLPLTVGGRVAAQAANLGIKGVNAARRKVGKKGADIAPIDLDRVTRLAQRAGKWGRKAGGTIADIGTTAASSIGNRLVDGVTNTEAKTRRERLSNRINRALMTGALATPPVLAIRGGLHGSLLDPEILGRGLDAFSHREIEKLDRVRAGVLAKLDGATVDDVLHKAGGRWSKVGQLVLPGLAAAGGALAGGGAAFAGTSGKKKGNPYRDADGRFTSRDRAVITGAGAIAGGALAGVAAGMAMRRGNMRAFRRLGEELLASKKRAIDEIMSPNGRSATRNAVARNAEGRLVETSDIVSVPGPTAKLVARRDARIKEIADNLPEAKAKLEALDRFGASAQFHYVQKARDEVTQQLAEQLAFHADVPLPGKYRTVGALMESVKARRPGFAGRGVGPTAGVGELASILDTVDAPTFKGMIANLRPAQRDAAQSLFDLREDVPNRIRTAMAGHVKALEEAEAASKAAQARIAAAAERRRDADALFNAKPEGDPEKGALGEALKIAEDNFTRAQTEADKAISALARLKSSPEGAMFPLSDRPIPPPNATQMASSRADIENAAREKASEIFEAELAATRAAEIERKTTWMNRIHAAHQMVGLRAGYTPKAMRWQARRYGAAARTVRQHSTELRNAEVDLASAIGARAKLSRGRPGIPKVGKPSVILAATRRRAEWDAATARVENLTARRDGAAARLMAAEQRMNAEAAAFERGLAASAKAAGRPGVASRILRNGMRAALGRDIERIRSRASVPVDKFLVSPTAANLREFAAQARSWAGRAKGTAFSTLRTAIDATYKTNGKWSPAKIARYGLKGGLVVGAAAGIKDAYDDARDVLFPEKGQPREWGNLNPFGRGRPFAIEDKFDPLTGEGYVIVSVQDPENKNERLVLWGEREAGQRRQDGGIIPGSRVSDTRKRILEEEQRRKQQQQQGGGGAGPAGDAANIPKDVKDKVDAAINRLRSASKLQAIAAAEGSEGAIAVRHHSDFEQANDDAGRAFSGWLQGSDMMAADGVKGRKFFEGLDALFSKQGQILKNREAYRLATGFDFNGQPSGKAIAPRTAEFGKDGDVGEGLDKVITYAQGIFGGQDLRDTQKAALHRLVTLVGAVKNVDTEVQKGLHAKIRQGRAGAGAAEAGPKETAAPPPPKPKAAPVGESGRATLRPEGWDEAVAGPKVRDAAKGLGVEYSANRVLTEEAVRSLAYAAKRSYPTISTDQAVKVARDTLMTTGVGDDFDIRHYLEELDSQVQPYVVKKGEFFDDLDGLMKAAFAGYDESKRKRDPEGQFTYPDGRNVGPVAGRGRQPQPPARTERGLTEPVRLGTEVGSASASQAAWMIAERFLPAPARVGAKVLRTGAILGGSVAAGAVGGEAGGDVGERYYRARGQKSPGAYDGPDYDGVDDALADVAGNIGGALAGTKAGALLGSAAGPGGALVGAFLGGVAGGIAGGEGARRAYHFLEPYGEKATGLIERYLGGAPEPAARRGMAKRAPAAPAPVTPHAQARVNSWLDAYGLQGKRVARHFGGI